MTDYDVTRITYADEPAKPTRGDVSGNPSEHINLDLYERIRAARDIAEAERLRAGREQ